MWQQSDWLNLLIFGCKELLQDLPCFRTLFWQIQVTNQFLHVYLYSDVHLLWQQFCAFLTVADQENIVKKRRQHQTFRMKLIHILQTDACEFESPDADTRNSDFPINDSQNWLPKSNRLERNTTTTLSKQNMASSKHLEYVKSFPLVSCIYFFVSWEQKQHTKKIYNGGITSRLSPIAATRTFLLCNNNFCSNSQNRTVSRKCSRCHWFLSNREKEKITDKITRRVLDQFSTGPVATGSICTSTSCYQGIAISARKYASCKRSPSHEQ